jgi:hypothetical protein
MAFVPATATIPKPPATAITNLLQSLESNAAPTSTTAPVTSTTTAPSTTPTTTKK